MKARILNVAQWLENGCDPKHAAAELRTVADKVESHISVLEDQRDGLYTQVDRLEKLSTATSPQTPIAKVTVVDGMVTRTGLYTPGLPDGDHDLYCEPEAMTPYLRERCVKCREPLPSLAQWSMPACPKCTAEADRQASQPNGDV